MNLSYWERKSWLEDIDFAVIGSGIVGLNCALALRVKHPKSKIVVFERGMLPSGASTKNAGFACYGSLSEILKDLDEHSEEEIVQLVKSRVEGLHLLRKTLGDTQLDYKSYGGFEVFSVKDKRFFEECNYKMKYVNQLLHDIFKADTFSVNENSFGFQSIHPQLIFSKFEGQIDTGKMMLGLIKKATEVDILILNNAEITSLTETNNRIVFQLNNQEEFSAKKMFIATNGFAKQFIKENVTAVRAQVVVTKPLKNLKIKGCFHLDQGYYYFRNVGNRILFGGGRNLDFKAEETQEMGLTPLVQNKLNELLDNMILPNTPYEIESRWSGIMGVGKQKKPIVKRISEHLYCGVRLGGMGVAIGSSIGQQLANLENE